MQQEKGTDPDRQLRELVAEEVKRLLGRQGQSRPLPYQSWMPAWHQYLLQSGGNVRKAWRQYRSDDPNAPSRHTLYKYRRGCPRFAEEWEKALAAASDSTETPDQSDRQADFHPRASIEHDPISLINYW
jgi:hypothetical protein